MFNQEKLEQVRKREQQRFEKSKQKGDARRRKVIRMMEEPLLPALCKAVYTCMWCFPAVTLAAVLINGIQNRALVSRMTLIKNILFSPAVTWMIFSVILAALCLIQLIRLKNGYQEKEYVFENELKDHDLTEYTPVFSGDGGTEADLQLYCRPVEVTQRYRRYLRIAVTGLAICLVLIILAVLL